MQPAVVAVGPVRARPGVVNAGHQYSEGAFFMGIEPDEPGVHAGDAHSNHALGGQLHASARRTGNTEASYWATAGGAA